MGWIFLICIAVMIWQALLISDLKFDMQIAKDTCDSLYAEKATLGRQNSDLRAQQRAAGTVINEVHHALNLAAGHIGQQIYSRNVA